MTQRFKYRADLLPSTVLCLFFLSWRFIVEAARLTGYSIHTMREIYFRLFKTVDDDEREREKNHSTHCCPLNFDRLQMTLRTFLLCCCHNDDIHVIDNRTSAAILSQFNECFTCKAAFYVDLACVESLS